MLLSNGKKQIINEKIKVLLNGEAMRLYLKDELYYAKTSFYTTDNLARKDSYYFEIILPDSTRHALAFIKPSKENLLTKFVIPDTIHDTGSSILKWTNLSTPHELDYIKSIEEPKQALNVTSYAYDGRTRDTLTIKEGSYKLPFSYLKDDVNKIHNVNITLTRQELGLMNPNLLPYSSIRYNNTISKSVTVD